MYTDYLLKWKRQANTRPILTKAGWAWHATICIPLPWQWSLSVAESPGHHRLEVVRFGPMETRHALINCTEPYSVHCIVRSDAPLRCPAIINDDKTKNIIEKIEKIFDQITQNRTCSPYKYNRISLQSHFKFYTICDHSFSNFYKMK